MQKELIEKMKNAFTKLCIEKDGDYDSSDEEDEKDIDELISVLSKAAEEHFAPIIQAKDQRIEDVEAELERVTGLLREYVRSQYEDDAPLPMTGLSQHTFSSYWATYCKEHNINQND